MLLSDSFKKITGYPNLVTGRLCAFSKNLELPLSGCYFSINAFNIKACFKARIKVLFNNISAKSVCSAY